MGKDPFLGREYTWIDDVNDTMERIGYKDPEPMLTLAYNDAPENGGRSFKAVPAASPAQGGGNPSAEQPGNGTRQGVAGPAPDLPETMQWVKDPDKLSSFLTDFNKKNPLNPSAAPKAVKDVYDNMKAPDHNYGPPTGAARDASRYWFNYMGFNDQYADNKGSVESKGRPGEFVAGSQAAGLNQVRPIAAQDVGFMFGNLEGGKLKEENLAAFRKAMEHPGFNSMVGSMVARKGFNQAKGDPFKAEAGYNAGFGTLRKAEREGKPWPNPGYVREMFPGQWDGNNR